jgi:NTE family protein
VAALSLLGGCAGLRTVNLPIDQVDPDHGYRPDNLDQHRDPGGIWLILAFSGGGTRAAALAYGVMEALRDTEVVIRGQKVRLLDEVDTISGVSGGSFPAAYYGLFGDRLFDDFEQRFLRKNVQAGLILHTLNPLNLALLTTPFVSRSDLASRYYNKNIFDGATFADLASAGGPRIHINATDLPSGERFRFNQGLFDMICSDIDSFQISYAVAASSAVPVVLSPVTLRNYAGRCGFEPPDWFEQALNNRRGNPRGHRAASGAASFLDADRKPYIHLVDGGISDNLGLRLILDRVAAMGGIEHMRQIDGIATPDHVVVVVVNAETEPDPAIDLSAAAPSLAASLNLVSGSQIRRYNFETMLLSRSAVAEFGSELSTPEKQVTSRLIDVNFADLTDEDEQRYFKRLPTSFVLSDEQVDRLREVGQRLLRESPQFQDLLEILR